MKDSVQSSIALNAAGARLDLLQPNEVPSDWSWLRPETLASLNMAFPLSTADQIPKLLTQSGIQFWGINVDGRLRALYLCSNHLQHQVTRIAFIALPHARGLKLLTQTFGQLADRLLSASSPKLSVYLLGCEVRRLWPLLRVNRHFFLEGRLRQVWHPALQRNEDVFVLSALGCGSKPPYGSLWLNASAKASRRFFSSWTVDQSITNLPERPARGSTLVDASGYQLRTLTAKDANETLVHWLNSPRLISSMNLPRFNYSLASVRALLASFDRQYNQFIGVYRHGSDQLIGFYTVLVDERARHAQLALCVYPVDVPAVRIMVDTITPLTDSFFERFAIQKITGNVLVTNRRMLLSLSYNFTFLLEAVLRQECEGDHSRIDVAVFSTFRDHDLRPKTGHFMLSKGDESP